MSLLPENYDSWKTTNPDDDDCPDEYHKLAEERYERELERQLEALEDRDQLNEDDPHPPECAWESPY